MGDAVILKIHRSPVEERGGRDSDLRARDKVDTARSMLSKNLFGSVILVNVQSTPR